MREATIPATPWCQLELESTMGFPFGGSASSILSAWETITLSILRRSAFSSQSLSARRTASASSFVIRSSTATSVPPSRPAAFILGARTYPTPTGPSFLSSDFAA